LAPRLLSSSPAAAESRLEPALEAELLLSEAIVSIAAASADDRCSRSMARLARASFACLLSAEVRSHLVLGLLFPGVITLLTVARMTPSYTDAHESEGGKLSTQTCAAGDFRSRAGTDSLSNVFRQNETDHALRISQ